uniref:Retinoic acid receptor responder protein 2 n=1 Tax=Crocodylus porosus TaxID=8502 RepID=A0A7M4DZN6_CROPO
PADMKGVLALVLSLAVLAAASRSVLQEQAVELALADFHSRGHVHWLFKEKSVEGVSAGTFIRMHLNLVPTTCRKQQERKQHCSVRPNGKKRNCLFCVKFDNTSPSEVLDKYMHCSMELLTKVSATFCPPPSCCPKLGGTGSGGLAKLGASPSAPTCVVPHLEDHTHTRAQTHACPWQIQHPSHAHLELYKHGGTCTFGCTHAAQALAPPCSQSCCPHGNAGSALQVLSPRDERECQGVEQAGEGVYLPGKFAFLHSQLD